MLQFYTILLRFTLLLLTGFLPFSSQSQSANFTYQSANGLFCSPVTVNFTQTSTGNPTGFSWSFGNGQFSNAASPSVIYTAPGTYTVKLVALFENQAAETSQTIVINPSITTTLTANRNYICVPGNIDFSASGTGNIASYLWNFGDGSPSVTTTSPAITHAYTGFGVFTANVTATDVNGCFSIGTYVITVQNPPITGTVSPTSGCIPAIVNFTANVTVPASGAVTTYSWNFGDGSPVITTAVNNISHNYTSTGSFLPILSIATNEGCANTYTYQSIAFGTPPVNHIAYPTKLVYCGFETPVFISKAVNANTYYWDYGDGVTETVTDTITQHKYTTLGTKTITATPSFNGCPGTPISFQIDVVGVIAGFTYANTCAAKKTFAFTNTTQGNQSIILWNFGDGSPTSSSLNVTHTYPASGTFITSLTVTDNITGCIDVFTASIYTANPTLTNPDTSICRNSNTVFTMQNNYTNSAASYIWNVVGMPLVNNSSNPYSATASILGSFPVNYAIINNGTQYCADTIFLNHPIKVRGPNLSFTIPASICVNAPLNITNTSGPFFPADAVDLWYWNYGLSASNDTTFQPGPVVYPSSGTYNIKLVAKDKTGCIDSLSKPIVANPSPVLRVFPRIDTLCLGQSATLIAFHNGNILWSPASLVSCVNCDTVVVSPTATTLFFATAMNSFGCRIKDSSLIKVYAPFTAVSIQSPVFICRKDTVRISAGPPGKVIIWSPATDLSASDVYTPIASPQVNTTYTAMLTDSAGCFSSTTAVDVFVKTLPTVNAGPDRVLPYNAMFTLAPVYSNNVISYNWSPASTLSCINCSAPTGINLNLQNYTIKVTSDSGCVAKDDVTVFVECKFANLLMPGAFTPNRDGKNDVYYPLTRGIKSIAKFLIYNRYGQLIFEKKNFLPNDTTYGWDGKFNGQDQTTDSYVYMIEVVCDLGELITKKGSFLLLR